MLISVNPKLPMRDFQITKNYYIDQLGFEPFGNHYSEDYLMVQKDQVQIHFFIHNSLDIKENYGQIYIRTDNIEEYYNWLINNGVKIHPNGHLEKKPWGQIEFSILDPDNNLLTFGELYL
ncbi:MAG: VOC family protein [Saprospiraceae bacterium]|mgnify:CR=1 FL=1|nr:VOC family protein [Saprospiraceae bacterium]HMT78612.1 VOC family protein [Saprospiraceae bacterium]HQU97084.1 VOC family protein [Saprospiraceae bacterium]